MVREAPYKCLKYSSMVRQTAFKIFSVLLVRATGLTIHDLYNMQKC